jgi:hypothetical protein
MDPKVCGGDVPLKEISKQMKPFVQLLVNNIGKNNYRRRDISMAALSTILRNPGTDLAVVIGSVMDICSKPEEF